jgi:splicing suppressor protein 51
MNKAQYFGPFDPYLDCFMLFHPGLGHPASSHEWEETLPQLLETKVPIICTGYTQWDLERDINWVGEKCRGEFDVLLEPGENIFRSLRWDLNDQDPHDVSCGNWGLWAFRGKRYVVSFAEWRDVWLTCSAIDTKLLSLKKSKKSRLVIGLLSVRYFLGARSWGHCSR